MGYAKVTLKVNISGDSAAAVQFPKTVCNMIEDGEYTNQQLYISDEAALYYSLLPNKQLDLKNAPSKASMEANKESDLVSMLP
jgi:hypothetical protein